MDCIGRYELLEQLGQGGMGTVYRARDPRDGRVVALKVMLQTSASEKSRKRFAREVDALCRVQHPGVVRVLEADVTQGGEPFMVMELLAGRTLQRRVEVDGPLAVEQAVERGRELCRAVAACHAAGVLHRDLKPDNVIETQAGALKLVDFGLTRDVNLSTSRSQLSVKGALLGSPQFWSPEQASGAIDELSPLTDVHGLGAVIFFLLTGEPPVQAESMLEAIQRAVRPKSRVRTLRADVPEWLDDVVAKALELDPADRFATATDLLQALARPASQPVVRQRTAARVWVTFLVATALVLLLGVGWAHSNRVARQAAAVGWTEAQIATYEDALVTGFPPVRPLPVALAAQWSDVPRDARVRLEALVRAVESNRLASRGLNADAQTALASCWASQEGSALERAVAHQAVATATLWVKGVALRGAPPAEDVLAGLALARKLWPERGDLAGLSVRLALQTENVAEALRNARGHPALELEVGFATRDPNLVRHALEGPEFEGTERAQALLKLACLLLPEDWLVALELAREARPIDPRLICSEWEVLRKGVLRRLPPLEVPGADTVLDRLVHYELLAVIDHEFRASQADMEALGWLLISHQAELAERGKSPKEVFTRLVSFAPEAPSVPLLVGELARRLRDDPGWLKGLTELVEWLYPAPGLPRERGLFRGQAKAWRTLRDKIWEERPEWGGRSGRSGHSGPAAADVQLALQLARLPFAPARLEGLRELYQIMVSFPSCVEQLRLPARTAAIELAREWGENACQREAGLRVASQLSTRAELDEVVGLADDLLAGNPEFLWAALWRLEVGLVRGEDPVVLLTALAIDDRLSLRLELHSRYSRDHIEVLQQEWQAGRRTGLQPAALKRLRELAAAGLGFGPGEHVPSVY